MKRLFILLRILLLLFAVALAFASCERSEAISDADLVGTWEIEDASARIYVAGVDLTDVLKLTWSYAEDEAAAMADSMETVFLEGMEGSVMFEETHSFSIMLSNEPEETGTWSLNDEGTSISLAYDGSSFDELTIDSYEETTLIIQLPAEEEMMDMNSDGTEDISVDVIFQVVLERVE